MSRVRVDAIEVTNFKRIEHIKVSLKPITALVGGNTSGKSSILQAAQLGVSVLQASFQRKKNGGRVEYLSTLANEGVSYRPTEYLLNLCHGAPATQSRGYEIGFTCTPIDDPENRTAISLSVKVARGKNANLSLDFSGDKTLMPVLGNRDQPFSIFAPGLSGIPLREEWRTRGALDAAAMHGDANLYLRTLLDHLFHTLARTVMEGWNQGELGIENLPEEAPWRIFSNLLDKCYQGARVCIYHDAEKERFVNVEVSYQGQAASLDMASTGMLQVIQILAYACLYRPPLLLLDEPDAHLHADSQARLYEALRGLTENTDIRIVFATHSPKLIQMMLNDSNASVVWMNEGNEVQVDGQGRPAIPLLMELGALTVGAEAFMPGNKIILLSEDKDSNLVRILAQANGAVNFACLSYNGCHNLSGARQLARLLTEARSDVKVLIHRDRDFRTPEEMRFELAVSNNIMREDGAERIQEIFTPLNDVEHSFLDFDHLKQVLDGRVTPERLRTMIDEVISYHRDKLILKINGARKNIESRLYETNRMQNKESLRAEMGLNKKAPNINKFIPQNGSIPLVPEQLHGKTVFHALIRALRVELNGDGGDGGDVLGILLKETTFLVVKNGKLLLSSPERPLLVKVLCLRKVGPVLRKHNTPLTSVARPRSGALWVSLLLPPLPGPIGPELLQHPRHFGIIQYRRLGDLQGLPV